MTSGKSSNESEQKPGTRDRLLDVAERVFSERGFAGASVREITDGAGANLGAINYYFRSKENLYAEVFTRYITQLRDQILADYRVPKSPTETDLELEILFFSRAFVAPHQDPAVRRRILDLFSREMTEACLPAGMLRELMSPVFELMMGIIRRARQDLDEDTVRGCAHSFLAQLMHLMKGMYVPADTSRRMAPVDMQLAHIARFTAAAVRHI
jgi:AcrR family transcriptional regulator